MNWINKFYKPVMFGLAVLIYINTTTLKGEVEETKAIVSISSEWTFLKYIKDFVETAEENGVDVEYIYHGSIDIFFDSLDDEIAVALGLDDDTMVAIQIDPSEWNKLSNQEKREIMFHELGHDVLNLEHGEGIMNADTIASTTPKSLDSLIVKMFNNYKEQTKK